MVFTGNKETARNKFLIIGFKENEIPTITIDEK
jgi:hypothetical protein